MQKKIQEKNFFYPGVVVMFIVATVTLGWIYLVNSTTIGTDIETVNYLGTGTSTFATTTIGTNFYVDEVGNASTTGYLFLADASTTGTFIVGGASTLTGDVTMSGNAAIAGTTTLATTTIGTNFYVDEVGNASTTGYLFLADASTTGTLTIGGESNLSTLVYGGATTTISTSTDDGPNRFQMTAAQFCDNSLVFFEDESASTTILYLPNASQLIGDCIPTVGDIKSAYLVNITDDTASTTLTASTSINLKMSSGEADAILNSLGNWSVENDNAMIWCVNKNGTEVDCKFETIVAGD